MMTYIGIYLATGAAFSLLIVVATKMGWMRAAAKTDDDKDAMARAGYLLDRDLAFGILLFIVATIFWLPGLIASVSEKAWKA